MTTIKKAKILFINLYKEYTTTKTLKNEIVDLLWGGRALNAYLALTHIPERMDPLDPKAYIFLSCGKLAFNNIPTGGRVALTFKSPLTNTLFTSTAGGVLGYRMAKNNTLSIALYEQPKNAKDWHILIVKKDKAELKVANELKGKDAFTTYLELKKQFSPHEYSILTISSAAEKDVRYAGVMLDGTHLFARGGAGSVFASKKLKAVIIHGTYDEKNLLAKQEKFNDFLTNYKLDNALFQKNDTLRFFAERELYRSLLWKYDKRSTTNAIHKIDGFFSQLQHVIASTRTGKNMKSLSISKNKEKNENKTNFQLTNTKFFPWYMLGPYLDIYDMNIINQTIKQVDNHALDIISLGTCLAELAKLKELNTLPFEHDATWGKRELFNYLNKIIEDAEIGQALAQGEHYFGATHNLKPLFTVKGMAPPPIDLHAATPLPFIISTRGGCHLKGGPVFLSELCHFPFKIPKTTYGIAKITSFYEDVTSFADSALLSLFLVLTSIKPKWHHQLSNFKTFFYVLEKIKFLKPHMLFSLNVLKDLLAEVSRQKISTNQIITIGRRGIYLERLFNYREGFSDEDDDFIYINNNEFRKNTKEIRLKYYKFKGISGSGLPKKKNLEKTKIRMLIKKSIN